MSLSRFSIAIVCLALAACAEQPVQTAAAGASARADDPAPGAAPSSPKIVVAKAAPAEKGDLPDIELTEQIMFKLMLAEVALQRGQPDVAVPTYLELARQTRDPRIAERATEIAWNARRADAALKAASIWIQTDPDSARARQFMGALLINQEKLDEARPYLEKWLETDRSGVGHSFLQLSGLLGRHKDKAGALKLMQSLAKPYPEVPEARLAVAQAAWNAGESDLALTEASAALKLRPDWELAALFRAQALQRRSSAEALAFLADYLKAHPDAKDVRLNYARLLVTQKQFGPARAQFERLLEAYPDNADVTMAVALLAMQANDYDAAEAQFKRVLELNYKDPDVVRMYLGQLNEDRKHFEDALHWYAAVEPGAQYIDAQARYAEVLAQEGRLAEARAHLREVTPKNNEQRVRLVQAEAQILREASDYDAAFDVLARALEKLPNYPDLLYDYAMAAEKVNRIDLLEQSLRKLIKLRPDNAHAYNALGYTLADRNERLAEARKLIETALKLSGDDPFILDSMGWVMFRLGKQQEALGYLRRAFAQRPDPEIAAHLGEVLWVAGEQSEARKVWSDVLKQHPKNELLKSTIERFAPTIHPTAQ